MSVRHRAVVPRADLDDAFRARMVGAFGADGARWLTQLGDHVRACIARWDLRLGDAYPDPSYQLVYPATGADGERLVLKVGVPRDELREEAAALRAWAGRGTVRLVADDQARGALLLERVVPGTQLADLAAVDDDAATTAWVEAFERVTSAGQIGEGAPDGDLAALPTLAPWGEGLARYVDAYGGAGPLDAHVVNRAAATYASLLASTSVPGVIHGDLHHHNILRSDAEPSGWVVIDPKGRIGDPAFEAGAFLRNPGAAFGPGVDGARRTRRRLDRIAERTGHDRERMVDWAWAGTVLSAVWCVEEDGPAGDSHAWPMRVADWIDAAR